MGEADEPPLQDRIHSFAKSHASDRSQLPTYDSTHPQASSSPNNVPRYASSPDAIDGSRDRQCIPEDVSPHVTADALPPPAPPPSNTRNEGEKSSPIASAEKPGWPKRIQAGSKRFLIHFKDAIFHSWINVLLVFVPIGIGLNWAPLDASTKPTVVFAMNAVAIIPLAALLSHATESVASSMGDTWASLLNVTFGNAVELIIFIALVKNEIRIVQASILGSILANLLLILGMAFLFGGLRFREQIYNSTVTQMSACLLSLSVTSLLLPTAFHAAFQSNDIADSTTIKISRGTSVVLLLVYILYLLFQLKSHAYMYESTPQQIIDEESYPGVLADIMNSSSSSSSDSDSSTSATSDSSSGSHNTAKKRIKRALKHRRRRRKSSTSSNATASSPSAVASPQEKRNIIDDSVPTSNDGYFAQMDYQRGALNGTAVMSGDEADTDGENERRDMAPQIRDFQTEQAREGESSRSANTSLERIAEKKPRKKDKKKSKRQQKKHVQRSEKGSIKYEDEPRKPQPRPVETLQATEPPRVGFTDNSQSSGQSNPLTNSPRRHFARQISRPTFKPPPFLSNTVFTTPQPPPKSGTQPVGLSIANRSALRRTSSMPERLNRSGQPRQSSGPRAQPPAAVDSFAMPPARRAGTLTINHADTKRKDAEEEDKPPPMSRTAATMLLLGTTALVAFCAELLVDAIPEMIQDTTVSQAFIGLIILPIVGNAAEHVTAVTVATKNKMDLAIGVAVGSSIQIALFVTPFVVLLGWILNKDMSLYFNLFETVSLFVTAFVVNFLVLDGRSNYLEGSLLIAAYIIIAVAAFFYPNSGAQSQLGGNNGG